MLVAETHAAVDLWCVDLDVDEPQFDAHTTVLNAAEWERARRFRFERQARRWSFSRAALRDILSRYTLTPPQKIVFALGTNGKPRLSAPPGLLHFNLSHAHGKALIGITTLASNGCAKFQTPARSRGTSSLRAK